MQGDFHEHVVMLRAAGAEACEVRTAAELAGVDALVIPGGESTTIARLLIAFDLREPLLQRIHDGMPVWGTCAGAILLGSRVPDLDREPLSVIDMTVRRNAFGRQVDSFERDLHIAGMDGPPLRAVFIRAPAIAEVADGVEVLATLEDGRIVACRQGRALATAFHPELTDDERMHRWFVDLARTALAEDAGAQGEDAGAASDNGRPGAQPGTPRATPRGGAS